MINTVDLLISLALSLLCVSYHFSFSAPVSLYFSVFYLFIIEFILKIEPLFINILICQSNSDCERGGGTHSNAFITKTRICRIRMQIEVVVVVTAPNTTHKHDDIA